MEDVFELSELKAANKIIFMTWAKPEFSKPGILMLEKNGIPVTLQYDAALFDAKTEAIGLSDQRLSKVWGNEIYRLTLTAKKQQLKGKYKFLITRNESQNGK